MKSTLLLLCLSALIGSCDAKMLKKGDKVPDFSLQDQDGNIVHFKDYYGKKVALYFYPMDNTPGCTRQACSLRDGYSELRDAGIVVLGISADSVKSHKKFQEKKRLQFTLLSDVDQKVAELFGVKRGWLLSWMGTKRVTFLVKHGKIVQVLKDIDLKHHADQIIKAFENE